MKTVHGNKLTTTARLSGVLALGLLVAGCSGGTGSTAEEESKQVQSAPITQSEEAAEESTSEEKPEAVPSAGPGCLIGVWRADAAFFASQFTEMGVGEPEIGGEVTVTFNSDGTTSTDYQEMSVTFVTDGEGTTIVRNGSDSGTYAATDTTISIENIQIDSVITLSMMDTENVMPGMAEDIVEWDYTCIGDQATMTGPDSAIHLIRKG